MKDFAKLVVIKILFGVACFILYEVAFEIFAQWIVISVFFGILKEPIWVDIAATILQILVLMVFAYKKRYKNTKLRNEYVFINMEGKDFKLSYRHKIKLIIKSIDFIAEMVAFFVVVLIFAYKGENMLDTPVGAIALILELFILSVIFVVINVGIWLCVKRTWFKERVKRGVKNGTK